MTDTANPMPEPAQRNPGDVKTDPGALTPEQQRRVRALGFARDTLVSRGMFAGTDVSKWSVGDLVALADWILQGSENLSPSDSSDFGILCTLVGAEGGCQSFVDLPPTGALQENDPPEPERPETYPLNRPTVGNPDPINRPEDVHRSQIPDDSWRSDPEPGGEPEDDGPALIEPSGWTAPLPPEEGNPGREPVDAP